MLDPTDRDSSCRRYGVSGSALYGAVYGSSGGSWEATPTPGMPRRRPSPGRIRHLDQFTPEQSFATGSSRLRQTMSAIFSAERESSLNAETQTRSRNLVLPDEAILRPWRPSRILRPSIGCPGMEDPWSPPFLHDLPYATMATCSASRQCRPIRSIALAVLRKDLNEPTPHRKKSMIIATALAAPNM